MKSSETVLPTNTRTTATSPAELGQFGIDAGRFERVHERISADVDSGLYPGAAIALARGGRLLTERTFGNARLADCESGGEASAASLETLWLLFSQTKPITSCALWILAERGLLNLHHPVAFYLPDFASGGKQDLTAYHLLTHQAGFPSANVPDAAWQDFDLMRRSVCNFALEYAPGSKVFYHAYSAHWVQAVLIQQITGRDFRQFIKEEVLAPLGLSNVFVGVPASEHHRLAGSYQCTASGEHAHCPEFDNKDFYLSGVPGAAGYATAGDIALFYQMLLGLGQLNGKRILSPRMVQYATTNQTGDRLDEFFGLPMPPRSWACTCADILTHYPGSAPAYSSCFHLRSWWCGHVVQLCRSGQRRIIYLFDQFPSFRTRTLEAAGRNNHSYCTCGHSRHQQPFLI